MSDLCLQEKRKSVSRKAKQKGKEKTGKTKGKEIMERKNKSSCEKKKEIIIHWNLLI